MHRQYLFRLVHFRGSHHKIESVLNLELCATIPVKVVCDYSKTFDVGKVSKFSKNRKIYDMIDELQIEAFKMAIDFTKIPKSQMSLEILTSCSPNPPSPDATLVDITEIKITSPINFESFASKQKVNELKGEIGELEGKIGELRADMKRVLEEMKQISMKAEVAREDALMKQLAINVEYEIKLVLIKLLPKNQQDLFYRCFRSTNRVNEFKIMNTSLRDLLLETVDNSNFIVFKSTYEKAVGSDANMASLQSIEDVNELLIGLKVLKDRFNSCAHPTTMYDGEEATLDYCLKCVQNLDSIAPIQKQVLVGRILDLDLIRQQNGAAKFLFS
eukprot:gene13648-28990_t